MKLTRSTAHRQPTPLLAALVLAALRMGLGQEPALGSLCHRMSDADLRVLGEQDEAKEMALTPREGE